jgi:hypothetical protein
MMKSKRMAALILAVAFTVISASSVAFASDIDYSQWSSNAGYPSDVVNTPLLTSVKYLIDHKILTGYSDGTFKPENNITKAEIAVAIAKATNRTANLEEMENKNTFQDLAGYGWAKGYINALFEADIIKGQSSTTFAPAKNISYAELVTILVRMNASAASVVESSGTWPNNYIQYVQMYNYLGDVTVTDWNAPANRGDAAKLIYRFLPKDSSSDDDDDDDDDTTTSAIHVDLKV